MVEYSKKFNFSKRSKFKIEDLFLVLIVFFNKTILSLTHFSNFLMRKYSTMNLVMESKNNSVLPLDNNLSEIITACWRLF